jgi:hypothetical protein
MKCLPVIGVGRIVALLKGETICDSSSRSRTALESISYIDEGSFSQNNARVTDYLAISACVRYKLSLIIFTLTAAFPR